MKLAVIELFFGKKNSKLLPFWQLSAFELGNSQDHRENWPVFTVYERHSHLALLQQYSLTQIFRLGYSGSISRKTQQNSVLQFMKVQSHFAQFMAHKPHPQSNILVKSLQIVDPGGAGYNPSYLGGWGRKILSSRSAWARRSSKPGYATQ